jgi:hypothetical protein
MARPPQRATPAQDATLLQTLRDFLAAPKALAAPVRWKPDPPHLVFAVALDIEGVTEPGFLLRARTVLAVPGEDISLQLTRSPPLRRNNFARLDWRPIQPHTNKRLPDPALDLLHLAGSHHHALEANAAHPGGLHDAIQQNLPVAIPFEAEPRDWAELAALAGRLWRIEGLDDAPAPPWQSDLTARRGGTP